jgi:hypothetical protein
MLNCRGKTESEFLADAGFVCNNALVIPAMLRNMTENTACTQNLSSILTEQTACNHYKN